MIWRKCCKKTRLRWWAIWKKKCLEITFWNSKLAWKTDQTATLWVAYALRQYSCNVTLNDDYLRFIWSKPGCLFGMVNWGNLYDFQPSVWINVFLYHAVWSRCLQIASSFRKPSAIVTRPMHIQIRLRECAGWSGYIPVRNAKRLVFPKQHSVGPFAFGYDL